MQVEEGPDRRLIRGPVTDQIDAVKTVHAGHLVQWHFYLKVTK
jgi:hypothetical protein